MIGLTGPAGSGKSEAAKYLVRGHGFRPLKFAGPMKAMLRAFYEEVGLTPEEIERRIEGDLKEVPDPYLNDRTPRHAMQTLGTEWGRNCMGADFWIKGWKHCINRESGPVVTDDCRFNNEADTIRELGGEIVKLEPKVQRRGTSEHISEAGVGSHLVDHTLVNDEGIGTLRERIDGILYPSKE